MINRKHLPLIFSVFLPSLLFANVSASEKNFIKGSLSDKISIVKSISPGQSYQVAFKAMDFTIENASFLSSDNELTELALASVKAFPQNKELVDKIPQKDCLKACEQFMTLFKLFPDNELRSQVMSRLELYSLNNRNLVVDFLNDFLEREYNSNAKAVNVQKEAIDILGKTGNADSVSVIFNIWNSKIWPEYKSSCDRSLLLLTQNSFSDIVRVFSASNISDCRDYFNLLKKSEQISQNFLCQIAETALLITINNVEKLSAESKDAARSFAGFQLEVQEILCAHKWSHAASVIRTNLILAKDAYEKGIMPEKNFIRLIETSVQIPSSPLAQTLTDMLSECNGKVEKQSSEKKSEMPAKSVVLALITALGVLGDKTAFDTLLYVTYLAYPIDVIDAAKQSLALLNW